MEVLYKRPNFASLVCLGVDSPIHLQPSLGVPQKIPQKTWNAKNSGHNTTSGSNNNSGSQVLTIYAHPLLCQNAAKNLK